MGNRIDLAVEAGWLAFEGSANAWGGICAECLWQWLGTHTLAPSPPHMARRNAATACLPILHLPVPTQPTEWAGKITGMLLELDSAGEKQRGWRKGWRAAGRFAPGPL